MVGSPVTEAECLRQMAALADLCTIHQKRIDRARGAAQVVKAVKGAMQELQRELGRLDAAIQSLQEQGGTVPAEWADCCHAWREQMGGYAAIVKLARCGSQQEGGRPWPR